MNRDGSGVSELTCWATMAVFAAGLAVLGVKLKAVQIDEASEYSYRGRGQSTRRVQTAGARGRIFDRNGVVLADSRRCVSIVCNAAAFQKKTWAATADAIAAAVSNVAAAVGRPSLLSGRDIRRHVDRSLSIPLVAWRDLDDGELARFAERSMFLPGFSTVETEERVYPEGSLASHLIGYVGRERVAGDAGDERFNFREFELCGRSGLELYYNGFLRGVSGEKKLLVDARGFTEGERVVSETRRGPDLRLSLDARLQRAAENGLRGLCGACVATDPRDGSVLAFASAPCYDLNEFVPVLPQEVYDRLLNDPGKPLLNRASGGAYAPGSTFKPVTALAALAAGADPDAEYECTGVFEFGDLKLRCARRWGHGPLAMRDAIRESCNAYFCNLGCEVGTNALISAARAFGLGARTGLDFTDDRAGVVPDDAWKRRTYDERWYPGDLAQMSIGQGMLLASPVQMAVVAGALGTGYVATPRLKAGGAPQRRALPFAREALAVVREGMRQVVELGSGRDAAVDGVAVCGKTGTAEVGSGDRKRKNTWFIAFAPMEAPTVALAVVVEDGESGGRTAAPIAGAVLREAFRER